ncbi:hypothetical protein A8W25_08185 [Streptomyces sp. ERV7]|uniref:HtaA domain-containing protein n=1 Tax=Streptomyces sp. ERV7 TaxID=1322334 RepID=UPI0007F4547A|nr:HtaA domain-containing protein [Streptomyces sp. ERV7]OAR25567.1 hypothetical protein A8W25_08185 [Streptomyces sp. ERV7]
MPGPGRHPQQTRHEQPHEGDDPGHRDRGRRQQRAGGGRTEVSEGSSAAEDGFGFPLAKAELKPGARKVNASFRGKVRFTYAAHGGLDIAFGAVRVEASGAKGALYVDVATPQGVKRNVEFASLDLSRADFTPRKDVVRLTAVPASFTAAGGGRERRRLDDRRLPRRHRLLRPDGTAARRRGRASGDRGGGGVRGPPPDRPRPRLTPTRTAGPHPSGRVRPCGRRRCC